MVSIFDSLRRLWVAMRSARCSGDLMIKVSLFFKQRLNFFMVHFSIFVIVGLISGSIIFALEARNIQSSVSFADGLFSAFSALCVTGLASTSIADFSYASQVIVLLLMVGGGVITVNILVLGIRRYFYRKLYADPLFRFNNPGLLVENNVEYLALGKLLRITLCYLLTIQLLSIIMLGLYGQFNSAAEKVLSDDGSQYNRSIHPWFAALFHSVSSFNNAGFTLMTDNLVPFITEHDYFYLIIMSFNIVLGNTAYPLAMRGIIMLCSRVDRDSPEIYDYLLSQSRRCSTHLFPARETRTLLLAFACLNLVEFVLFLILDWHSDAIANHPAGIRILIGYFQSISTRTAGFNCIDLSKLSAAMNVLYLAMMYISSYPIFITTQHTKLHRDDMSVLSSPSQSTTSTLTSSPQLLVANRTVERASVQGTPVMSDMVAIQRLHSSPVFRGTQRRPRMTAPSAETPRGQSTSSRSASGYSYRRPRSFFPKKKVGYVRSQLRTLLLRDFFWIYSCFLVIAAIENQNGVESFDMSDPSQQNHAFADIFRSMFELISAYGTVGLTLGTPSLPSGVSFSYSLTETSKILVAFIMLLGRHRSMPGLDPAVEVHTVESRRRHFAAVDQEDDIPHLDLGAPAAPSLPAGVEMSVTAKEPLTPRTMVVELPSVAETQTNAPQQPFVSDPQQTPRTPHMQPATLPTDRRPSIIMELGLVQENEPSRWMGADTHGSAHETVHAPSDAVGKRKLLHVVRALPTRSRSEPLESKEDSSQQSHGSEPDYERYLQERAHSNLIETAVFLSPHPNPSLDNVPTAPTVINGPSPSISTPLQVLAQPLAPSNSEHTPPN